MSGQVIVTRTAERPANDIDELYKEDSLDPISLAAF